MNSLKFTLAPLVLALSLPAAALADEPRPATTAASTLLTITAEGKSTRTPDVAMLSAGVATEAKTASEAMNANAALMNRVIAALKNGGIADKDIQTSSINLSPVYSQPVIDSAGQTVQEPRIVGYQANNMVTIRSRDIKGFGKVLDTLIASGANQINGPTFQLSDPASANDEARISAMKSAATRADLYAKAAGLRVVRIINITEGDGYVAPRPRYAFAESSVAVSAPTPISAGEVDTQINLTVQFELAP